MRTAVFIFILGSITLFPITGKASAENLPVVKNGSSHTSKPKDSAKDTKSAITQLLNVLQGTGTEDKLEGAVPVHLGFTTEPPIKYVEEGAIGNSKRWEHRECAVIYSDDSGGDTTPPIKKPSCIYIYRISGIASHASSGYWFLADLEGNLQKAVLEAGKNDEKGMPIHGSGVYTNQDITSPEIQKAFKVEMAYWTKNWLKKQTGNKTSQTTKSKDDTVRESASAESKALDKEASDAPAPAAH